ncbi:hypothetical protein N2152v2_001375 [Parachlorella kessleri]
MSILSGAWRGFSSRQGVVQLLQGQRWEHYSQYNFTQKTGSTTDKESTASESSTSPDLGCDTLWVDQPVDQYNQQGSGFWQQRVHVCTGFWGKGPNEPLFFYAGDEGAVEKPFPTMFSDWAQQDGGLLVYAEHRYYGESMPQGASSLTAAGIQWLAAEQAIADYVGALRYVRQASVAQLYQVPSSAPAVAYGGSYGGMLAAYLRLFYPDDFDVSVAMSAPVKYLVPTNTFKRGIYDSFEVLTQAVQDAGGSDCSEAISLGFQTLADLADSQEGRSQLEEAVGFCTTGVLESPESVNMLADTLRDAWWGLFQYLNDTKDTLTIYSACQLMQPSPSGADNGLAAVRGLGQFYLLKINSGSSTQQIDCLSPDVLQPFYTQIETTQNTPPEARSYNYQGCHEGFPRAFDFLSSTAKGSIFGDGSFDWEAYVAWCQYEFGLRYVSLPPKYLVYDEDTYSSATNIVFTNGGYDPWSAGSVLQDLSSSVVAIVTPRTSHCFHIRPAQPETDSPEMTAARAQIVTYVQQMLASGRRKLLSNRRLLG